MDGDTGGISVTVHARVLGEPGASVDLELPASTQAASTKDAARAALARGGRAKARLAAELRRLADALDAAEADDDEPRFLRTVLMFRTP